MSEEKKDLEELQSEELKDVNGGAMSPLGDGTYNIWMPGTGESRYCGVNVYGVIKYRPCPRCNKPMHTEWYTVKWYCDPCDFSEYRPREEVWNGSEESLIEAAK